ncbi:MAG: septum formation initiator family protein [Ignavibacteria bacterium]|nr:septum formation initiator family protein [Ignavibacteria bacterium]
METKPHSDGKSDGLLKIVMRFIKYNKKVVLFVLVLTGLIVFASVGNKGLISRIKMESERKDLEEQLKAEQMKTKELQKDIEELKSSDKKIEQTAREKYGMTKENETIYKILIDSTK